MYGADCIPFNAQESLYYFLRSPSLLSIYLGHTIVPSPFS